MGVHVVIRSLRFGVGILVVRNVYSDRGAARLEGRGEWGDAIREFPAWYIRETEIRETIHCGAH